MNSVNPNFGHVHIGTSGWHYSHWRGPFYPAGFPPAKMLRFYAERFDSVEINNSFYRLPTTEALKLWCKETPENFCFAVKASRYITHNKKLTDPQESVKRFMLQIRKLRKKLGPILFQLPPGWKLNADRLDEFLRALPRKHRYVVECRNPTWNVPEIYATLHRHNSAYCIFELAGFQSPMEITADFAYIRLHGPGNKYQGSYSDEQLHAWARQIQAWRKKLKHVFIYFDNDQAGFAAQNAMKLKQILGDYRKLEAA